MCYTLWEGFLIHPSEQLCDKGISSPSHRCPRSWWQSLGHLCRLSVRMGWGSIPHPPEDTQQPPFQKLLVRPLSLKQLTESRPASHSISWQVARARVRLLKHDPRPSRRRKAAHWSDLASSCVNCDVHITLHSFQETSHVHPWLIHVNACKNHHNTVIN